MADIAIYNFVSFTFGHDLKLCLFMIPGLFRAIEEARLCSLAHAVLCHITNISLQRKVQEAESLYNCGTNTTTEGATQATEVTFQVTEVTSQVSEVTTEVTASTTESEATTTEMSYKIRRYR